MLRLVAALIVAGIAAGPASAQDASLIGRWRTAAQNGVVEIHACGPALCASVVDAAPLRLMSDVFLMGGRDNGPEFEW